MTEYGHKYHTLPADLNVKQIMDTWTVQPGYPVVTVIRNGSDVTITQQRYMLPQVDETDLSRWYVPITFETEAKRTEDGIPSFWLSNMDNITMTNVVDPNHWMYVNIKRAGYYRVNYDHKSWLTLSRNFNKLPPVIKGQLLDDALHLARAEILTYDIPLTFLMQLSNLEFDNVLPWAAATPGLNYLTHMLNREPAYEQYRVS